jgi:glycosyltransferase involved in cell wall biosynthesis
VRIVCSSEARFERTPDAKVWAQSAFGRDLWTRYLQVFDEVAVIARMKDVQEPRAGWVRSCGDSIVFRAIPPYSGAAGFVAESHRTARVIVATLREPGAILLRVPSAVAFLTHAFVGNLRYGVEVVGDPRAAFAPGVVDHPLRAALRSGADLMQRRICRSSHAALYVTERYLQDRYPTRGQQFAASDVDLDDSAFAERAVDRGAHGPTARLVTVGSLEQAYKGTAVLLEAAEMLVREGLPFTLRIVGSGRMESEFKAIAERRGLGATVSFPGQLDRAGVRHELDQADLFVLPSLTEGLPRALVEAMARGLPAVATAVGGVPELLPAQCLVNPGDARGLARTIRSILEGPAMPGLALQNRARAERYHEAIGSLVRRSFLECLRTAEALDGGMTRSRKAGFASSGNLGTGTPCQ